MLDLNNSTLVAFSNWTLRVRESSDPNCRLMLLVHGLTGDENSMWVFGRNMPARYWLVAPRAPHPVESGGYSWRPPFEASEFGRPTLEQLRLGADGLVHRVDDYAASAGIDAETFDVMGFSQGGALSNVLAFLYPQRVRKTAILAGFVPGGLEDLDSKRPLEGKPFFVAHGTRDEMVRIDRQATAEFLRAVEVGEGQNPGAVKVLDLMRRLDDRFWRTVNAHPSKAYLDTYEKKLGVLEEGREEALFKLARDGRKQGLEEEAYAVWTGLLKDVDAPLRFDAKEGIVLAAGEIPEEVSARIKAAAIAVNGQLYLRDAFLELIPQVKEIREWSGERVRVRAQPGPAVPDDLLPSLEALLPYLQEDLV